MKRRDFIKRTTIISAGLTLLPTGLLHSTPGNIISSSGFTPEPENWKDDEINIAWIGHSTVLIKIFDKIVLTDPVFYERVGVNFLGLTFGPSRFTAPALDIDKIPKPDIVLLSHAHMDHMDTNSLSFLADKFENQIDCITAFNTKDVIQDLPWKSLVEMDWKESLESHGIKFTALEVKHFGWRLPWENDRSRGYFNNGRSYNAYLIEKNGKRVVFGGDTAFSEKLKGVITGGVDVAIMPIGAYSPWKWNHCNPEEALEMAASHLGAKYFIPIHCLTFRQGKEPDNEPLERLRNNHKLYNIELGLDMIGQTFSLKS